MGHRSSNEIHFAFGQHGNAGLGGHLDQIHGVGVAQPALGEFVDQVNIKTNVLPLRIHEAERFEIIFDTGNDLAACFDLCYSRNLPFGRDSFCRSRSLSCSSRRFSCSSRRLGRRGLVAASTEQHSSNEQQRHYNKKLRMLFHVSSPQNVEWFTVVNLSHKQLTGKLS